MKNLGLGAKLLFGFGTVLALFVLVMGVYQFTVTSVQGDYHSLLVRQVAEERAASNAETAMLQMRRDEKDYLARFDKQYVTKHAAAYKEFVAAVDELDSIAQEAGDAKLAEKAKAIRTDGAAYKAAFGTVVADYEKMGLTADLTVLLPFEQAGREAEAALPKARTDLLAKLLEMRRQEKNFRMRRTADYKKKVDDGGAALARQMRAENLGAAAAALDRFVAEFDTFADLQLASDASVEVMRTAVHKVEPVVQQFQADARKAAGKAETAATGQSGMRSTIAIALGLGGLAAGLFAAFFIRGSIMNPINRVISGLRAGAEQVTAAANQVAQASQQMAQGASEQASSLEETSSSLEEMASMTRQNAGNSKQADAMARETREAAGKGLGAMQKMSESIVRIKDSADSTAKIIKTIDEIAFQTNLLALNAAVEAARAGEAGKGFAVVAEEVRNLAQRSAEAAKTTAALIEGSQTNADDGVKNASEVAALLEQIAEAVDKVTSLVSEVAAASDEQTQGIDQINTAVSDMDTVTQSNAANSEESASASEELSAQARELNEMVNTLTAIIGGASVAAAQNTHLGINAGPALAPMSEHQLTQLVSQTLSAPAPGGNGGSRKEAVAVGAKRVKRPQEVIPLDDDELKDF